VSFRAFCVLKDAANKWTAYNHLNNHHIGDKEDFMEKSQKSQAKIVMPAIYQFSFATLPAESKWGWHNAEELVEAINNIRVSMGKESIGTAEIINEYSFINPHSYITLPSGFNCCVIVENGQSFSYYNDKDWLGDLVNRHAFLPAKLGMSLIKAAKKPILSAVRRACN
jgi:hypothetical protein